MPGFLRTIYREYDQETGQVVLEKVLFDSYDTDTKSCAQGEEPFQNLSLSAARIKQGQCLLSAPSTPNGYFDPSPRDCQQSALIVTDLGAYAPDANPDQPTLTTYVTANPDVFSPALQWQNGMARIVNQASPNIPAGKQLYYWFSGQPPLTALPTGYNLLPGDEIQLMVAVSATPDVSTNTWTQKSSVLISVGPAPTT